MSPLWLIVQHEKPFHYQRAPCSQLQPPAVDSKDAELLVVGYRGLSQEDAAGAGELDVLQHCLLPQPSVTLVTSEAV